MIHSRTSFQSSTSKLDNSTNPILAKSQKLAQCPSNAYFTTSRRVPGLLSVLPGLSLRSKNDVLPSEHLYHAQISPDPAERWKSIPPVLEDLKKRAKQMGLWNLWLSGGEFQGMAGGEGGGLSNLEVGVANLVE